MFPSSLKSWWYCLTMPPVEVPNCIWRENPGPNWMRKYISQANEAFVIQPPQRLLTIPVASIKEINDLSLLGLGMLAEHRLYSHHLPWFKSPKITAIRSETLTLYQMKMMWIFKLSIIQKLVSLFDFLNDNS